jgi:O-antigen/teichoic acid export membrane protein
MSFIGTSATTVLSEFITLLVTYYITCRILKVRFTIPKLEKIVISTTIMTIIIFIARNLNIFAIVLIGILTYTLALYLIGGIDKEYLKLLRVKTT